MNSIKEYIDKINEEKFNYSFRHSEGLNRLNLHQVIETLSEQFDKDAQAERCSNKYYNLEGHKYFHKSPEDIKSMWEAKASESRELGSNLDTFIDFFYTCDLGTDKRYKLWELDVDYDSNAPLKSRCENFKEFASRLERLGLVPLFRETPLYFYDQALNTLISGREDAVYIAKSPDGNDSLVLIDWKSSKIEKPSDIKFFKKMYGPCSHLYKCDLTTYTIQVYMYKHFLEKTYGLKLPITAWVVEITPDGFFMHKPTFEYDEGLIEKIISYAIKKTQLMSE